MLGIPKENELYDVKSSYIFAKFNHLKNYKNFIWCNPRANLFNKQKTQISFPSQSLNLEKFLECTKNIEKMQNK